MSEDIDQESFAHKHTELQDRLASIKLQLDPVERSHDETAELAARVFELLQTKRQQWLTAEKRRLLEIVFLNCTLDGVTLCPEMRKPFDVLAEGLLVSSSRGDWIQTSDLLNPIQEATQPNVLSNQADTPTAPSACTNACTNQENIDQPDPLAALAAALLSLSSADRARLAAMLLGQQEGR